MVMDVWLEGAGGEGRDRRMGEFDQLLPSFDQLYGFSINFFDSNSIRSITPKFRSYILKCDQLKMT